MGHTQRKPRLGSRVSGGLLERAAPRKNGAALSK
jgi:hypothetical protein